MLWKRGCVLGLQLCGLGLGLGGCGLGLEGCGLGLGGCGLGLGGCGHGLGLGVVALALEVVVLALALGVVALLTSLASTPPTSLVGSTYGLPAALSCLCRDTAVLCSVVESFLWPAQRPGTRSQTTFEIRRVLLAVFVVT